MKSLFIQIKIDLKRSLFRNMAFVFFTLIMPIGFYILLTRAFDIGIDESLKKEYYKQVLIQMTVYSVMISSMFSFSLLLIEDRNENMQKIIRLAPISEVKYYISKITTQFIVNLLAIVFMFFIGYVVNNVTFSIDKLIFIGIWILLSSLPIMSLASIVSFSKNSNTASSINNMIIMPMAIMSGLWWPIDMFPKVVQNIAKVLPSYYSVLGARAISSGKSPSINGVIIMAIYVVVFISISININKKRSIIN